MTDETNSVLSTIIIKEEEDPNIDYDGRIHVKQELILLDEDGNTHVKQEELFLPDEGTSNWNVSVKEEMTSETESTSDGLTNMEQEPYVRPEEEPLTPDEGAEDSCHTTVKCHQCPHCDYKSLKFANVKKHIMRCHTSETPQRPHCDYKSVTPQELNQHTMASHTSEKPHHCPHCEYKAVRLNSVKRHILSHHTAEKPHRCDQCDYQSVRNIELKHHIMVHHTGIKPYHCQECDYKTVTPGKLKRHIMCRHTGEKPHQCPLCDYKSAQSSNVKLHIMACHTRERPHHCPHCDYKAVALNTVKRHIASCHAGEKPYQCAQCDYKSVTHMELKKHIKANHIPEKRYHCPHCDYKTVTPGKLKRHMFRHTGEKPHQCPICDYKSAQSGNVKIHLMACHVGKKPRNCPHCEYQSFIHIDLKQHIMAHHIGEKPYHCPQCDYKSVTPAKLKRHIMFRHTGEKPHQCPLCDYKSAQASSVKIHIMASHTGEKPRHCLHCEYKCRTLSELKRHTMSHHTGEKPHHCSQCDYKSVALRELKRHIMVHHKGVKPHQCPLCDYKSTQTSNVKRHIMARHTDKMDLKQKKSVIWQFFTPVNELDSICNICKRKMKYKSSITNLRSHIRRKHPTIKIDNLEVVPDRLPVKKNSSSPFGQIDATLNLDANLQPVAKPVQSAIEITPQLKKIGLIEKKKLDNSLLKLITKDFQPLSIVEDEGFREYSYQLNPAYQIPNQTTLANILLPAKHLEVLEHSKNIIRDAVSVTITTETWTSYKNESFTAVTAHFMDSNYVLRTLLLETCDFSETQTSSNIASELIRVVTDWGIENKILLAITDYTDSMKKAIIEELQWHHFDCLSHTINLIVQDSLKPLKNLICRVKEIVSHIKTSLVAKTILETYQKQSCREPKNLIQALDSSWHSEFLMLERFIELKKGIQTTLAIIGKPDWPIITNQDFDILNEIVEILAPMEAIGKNMSDEKYITASSLIIISNGLKELYQSLSQDMKYSSQTKESINIINKGIHERLGCLESSETLLISTFLDPRFKNIGFSSDIIGDQARAKVTNIVASIIKKESKPTQMNSQTREMTSYEDKKKIDFWRSFDKKIKNFQPVGTHLSSAFIEVQRYVEEPPVKRNLCPLNWWKTNAYKYPNLSKVVRENFVAVATSVSGERKFSVTGQTLSNRRKLLSSNKVKTIMFINKNS